MKKVKRPNRSFRVRADLMAEAEKQGIIFSQFAEKALEDYLNGKTTCPTCGQKVSTK
jgi:hypothetical protein